MDLKSMKLSAKEQAQYAQPTMAAGGEQPEYPYGLVLRLEGEQLKALGLSVEGMKVGQGLMLHAKAQVKGISESKTDKETHQSVELQITDMAQEAATEKADNGSGVPKGRSAESVLYAGGGNVAFEQ